MYKYALTMKIRIFIINIKKKIKPKNENSVVIDVIINLYHYSITSVDK